MSQVKRAPHDQMKKEVSSNFKVFTKMPFESKQKGKFALLKNRKLIGILDTRRDALNKGNLKYPDGLFSVQEVGEAPVEFGIMSHAWR